MLMIIGVPREILEGERGVSLVHDFVSRPAGSQVSLGSVAGENAGFPDSIYSEKGIVIAENARVLYAQADLILKVHSHQH